MDLRQFQVINASGRMTVLGGCTLSAGVLDAMRLAAESHYDMERLHRWAGERIAARAGTEAARVVGSAASGIVLAVAAVVAGSDPVRVRALPDPLDAEARIVIQTGHLVDFGAEIGQMVRLGGGRVVSVGSVNRVDRRDLDAMMRTRPAGCLFVWSHHAVQKGMLSLANCVEAAHQFGVPVIVDAAAEDDLAQFTGMGADLAIYSGSKDLRGPTAGVVVGRRRLVDAVAAQSRGIGRAMKVSKEAIAGVVKAIQDQTVRDSAADRLVQQQIVARLLDSLRALRGATAAAVFEDLRPHIERAQIQFSGPDARDRAARLVAHLREWMPPIWTRDHRLGEGIVVFDPRPLSPTEAETIAAALQAFHDG